MSSIAPPAWAGSGAPATRTSGRYQLGPLLGHGGMGRVYEAWDPVLGRRVALKVLYRDTPEDLLRFLREATFMARVQHPHICPVFDVDETSDPPAIAMRLIQGPSLEEARERLSLDQVLVILETVARAVQAAHEAGLIHRDLKPSNVLLEAQADGGWHPFVTDFGLAKDFAGTHQSLSWSAHGTPAFMSPEQARCEPVDPRTDVYALGATLYATLAGGPPIAADSLPDLLRKLDTVEPPPLRQVVPTAPKTLERILARCLARDPASRYPTALAFAEDLARLRSGKPVTAPGLPDPRRRRRQVAATVAAAVVLAAAGFGFYPLLWPPRRIASLAVLPFKAGDPETIFLADGLGEVLVSDLEQRPGLKVTGRDSARHFRNRDLDPAMAARELGVEALLLGSWTHRDGQRILAAELLAPATREVLWRHEFRFGPGGVPELGERLVTELGRGRIRLPERLGRPRRFQSDAFDLYLRGMRAVESQSEAEILKGFGLLDEAMRLDPAFPHPHAAKAVGYHNLAGLFMPNAEGMRRARDEARAALALDPALPQGHSLLGYGLAVVEHDFARAEAELRRGVELAPSSANARAFYAYFLSSRGRAVEATAEAEKAVAIDPFSPTVAWIRAIVASQARDWPAVRQLADRLARQVSPDSSAAQTMHIKADLAEGKPQAALDRIHGSRPGGFQWIQYLEVVCLVRLGRTSEAEVLQRRIQSQVNPQTASEPYEAASLAALGRMDAALHLLEKLIQERQEAAIFLNVDPAFDPFRHDPRFRQLLEKHGLI